MSGPDASQAESAGTSQQSKQNGLGLVGAGVPCGHCRAFAVSDQRLEERMPVGAASSFEVRPATAGPRRDILPPDLDRVSAGGRQGPHEPFVLVRLTTSEAVVEVDYAKFATGKEFLQGMQQSDRVRAAGHGDSQPAAGWEHPVSLDPLGDLAEHSLTVQGRPGNRADSTGVATCSRQRRLPFASGPLCPLGVEPDTALG